ncbi:GspH/FimT family pseudopilin [Candidatus Sororendozoicomonas aggregata]|uniref:GspH/FimT family pseudopilin n=1 Tax=Candidatus Sororendozoicomonas aggregata TaxID=3073239 RepID=UPI002ED3E08C
MVDIHKGFTLPELVTTLAVAAILVSLAAPSMKSLLADRRIAAVTQQLYGSILLARSEAVTRGMNVSICRASGIADCASEGDNWASGWLIFVDGDSNGLLDAGDELLRVYQSQPDILTIIWNRGQSLRINSRGQARDFGTFTLCESLPEGVAARTISISLTGRARVSDTDTCS